MTEARAAIQLIVFGEQPRNDLPGVLRAVANAGFEAIEAGVAVTVKGAAAVRSSLQEAGLHIAGCHFGYGDLADDAKLDQQLDFMRELGIKPLMCSGVLDGSSAEGFRESARRFNRIGRRAAEAGAAFHYHNHDWEFRDLGGVTGMSVLLDETDPGLVKLNPDVFWLWFAGLDPVQFIQENAARCDYFHFKDGVRKTDDAGRQRPRFLELGRGEVDLPAAMAAARACGAQWIVAEQDSSDLPAAESAAISRQYMKEKLGV